MAVQKRNSEMVDLLRADFIHKNDVSYNWAMLNQMYATLPGIVGFWSMAAISKEDTSLQFNGWGDLPNLIGLWPMNEISQEDLSFRWIETLDLIRNLPGATGFWGMGALSQEDLSFRWIETLDLISNLPGVIGFWGMGALSKDDKIYLGRNSVYDLTNERIGIGTLNPPYELTVDGITRIRQPGSTGYRTDHFVTGGAVFLNAFDDTGGVYIDMHLESLNLIATGAVGGGWISLSLTNSGGTTWANFGGIYQVAQYRKFGDIVQVRGLVTRTAGAGLTIANLPLGYRPPAQVLKSSISNDAACRIDLDTSGNIIAGAAYAAWIAINFDFSITA